MKNAPVSVSDEIILEHLNEDLKEKLTKVFYLDEFCDQIKKNQSNIKGLVDETFDYLKEADICLTKKAATSLFKEILERIEETLNKVPSEEENSENEGEEDYSELNDLDDGKEVEGQCEMCFSAKHLTLHHAIPKLMIKRFIKDLSIIHFKIYLFRLKRKKKKAPVIYLKLCRQCHS